MGMFGEIIDWLMQRWQMQARLEEFE